MAIFSLPASAATYTVTILADSGAGSLRQAVLDANATLAVADTIEFQAGLTGTISLTSGPIAITDRLTINGPGESILTVSASSNQRVFTVASAGATIQGLTIKKAGGIANTGFLTLNHLTLTGNSGGGGGINNSGSLTASDLTLSGNNSIDWDGGGIYNTGILTLSNSALVGNKASRSGGGIYNARGKLTVINCTLAANQAQGAGGGIWNNANATVVNSTLSGNAAFTSKGGGFYNESAGILTVGNSIVVGNIAALSGNEVYVVKAGFTSQGTNLFGENNISGVEGVTPPTLLVTDLILPGTINTAIGEFADNGGSTQTYLLAANSPAIDHGNNSLIPAGVTTDQRGPGFPRILGSAVDIGAVESGGSPPTSVALTVSNSGGNGTVTSNPTGINCGTTCTANFNSGTSVTLTATPDSGYRLSSWGGACSGTGVCTVTMNMDKGVSATFTKVDTTTYTLTVAKTGNGTVSGGGKYAAGATVNLTATPATGSTFTRWNPSPPCATVFTMPANDLTCTATFTTTPPPTYLVTVAKSGNGTISGGGRYAAGATVKLTATPAAGSTFAGWSPNPCAPSFTMPANALTCTATFNATNKVSLTLNKAGAGLGTVVSTPSGIACGPTCFTTQTAQFTSGINVTLTATPVAGFTWAGWTGCTPLTNTLQCTVAMTAARTVTATFGSPLPPVSLLKNGSFEQYNGLNPGASYRAIPAGSTDLLNWTVSGNKGIDLLGMHWVAADGKISLDLDGTPGAGGVAQAFATTPGKTYTVLFNLAGNPSGYNDGADAAPIKNVQVRAAGQQVNYSFNVTGKTVSNMGWEPKAWSFTATTAQTTLQFTSLSANPSSQFGPAIDNVQVFEGRYVPLAVLKAGTGTVTGMGITCGSDCSEIYPLNTSVTLTATPVTGWTFTRWTGCTASPADPKQCTVLMNVVKTVKATFTPN